MADIHSHAGLIAIWMFAAFMDIFTNIFWQVSDVSWGSISVFKETGVVVLAHDQILLCILFYT